MSRMKAGPLNLRLMDWLRRNDRGWLLLLLGLHLGFMGRLTVFYSPTLDETAHLPAGLSIWRSGRTDLYRVNPPLVRGLASLPLLALDHQEDWSHYRLESPRRSEWDVGADFARANGSRTLWLLTVARWMCLPFSLIGLLVCWSWGRELTTPAGGWIAAALWGFSPNLLSHGALLTNDVAATSLGLLAAWRFQHWLIRPSLQTAFAAGFCLGLALLSKLSWVILPGLWLLIGIIGIFWRIGIESPEILPSKRRRGLELVAIQLLGLMILNMGYGYHGTGTPLGQIPFYSRILSGTHRNLELDSPGNRFEGTWLGRIPVAVPVDYLAGIDLQQHDFERPHTSYLLGVHRKGGWWWYYLVGLGVKVPLGTWLLAITGALLTQWQPAARIFWQRLLPLWLPALTLFVIASTETGINRHLRYVFPVLPLGYLLAANASTFRSPWMWRLPLLATVIASLSAYPHSLSYFNLLAGGPAGGSRVLIDSNLDWGQDLLLVKDWLEQHPDCRPATLAAVSSVPREVLGIDIPQAPTEKAGPGWHLISIHLLNSPGNSYSSFKKLRPVGRVGSTINIYHVSEDVTGP